MTEERAIRLAREWAFGGMCSIQEGEAQEYHRMALAALEEMRDGAMPVVRCRECRWRGREECAMFYRCSCGEQHTWETDEDYCSYGEQKDGTK